MVDGLPRRRRRVGSVWAVCLAKNEEDIIVHSTRHMLDQGVDGVIVVDNGSTDRTGSLLAGLALEDARVHAGVDAEPGFFQGMKTSYLAHLAWRAGADWVVPFDADEFWYAPGTTVAALLARLPDTDRVWAHLWNAYPLAEDGMLDLASGRPVQVDRRPTAWMKIAFRARRWVWVGEGNHDLRSRGSRPQRALDLLHFSCRSLDQYSRKALDGVAALHEAGMDESIATHWREWAMLTDGERAARWSTYVSGEASDLSGTSGPAERVVVPDPMRWPSWDPGQLLDDGA
ncbi:glycosyltransferase family 2 protein [Agromyces ramosus]|uniref:glycosyltransferase family 2 protein n=1 Tax=Agromyces ramosus TaxID=33879 RepID=UPI00102B4902|nr:glycosyltransferase family 2 protein [Agromyces ramosus]